MGKHIIRVEVVFENCEYMNLLPKDIFSIHVKGITKNIVVQSDALDERYNATYVYLGIRKQKFEEYMAHYGGITQIWLCCEDGTTEWFYVPYEEGMHQENNLEHAGKKDGRYVIEIGTY